MPTLVLRMLHRNDVPTLSAVRLQNSANLFAIDILKVLLLVGSGTVAGGLANPRVLRLGRHSYNTEKFPRKPTPNSRCQALSVTKSNLVKRSAAQNGWATLRDRDAP